MIRRLEHETPLAASSAPIGRWPSDFVSLDEGKLLVRRDFISTFEELGWTTLAAIMNTERCHVVRRVGQRDNCRLLLRRDGSAPIQAYLKRHRGSFFGDWLRSRIGGSDWHLPGVAEAEAVGACQQHGVPTMDVIAAGESFGSRPWQGESFFLSEAIDGGTPADDYWKLRFPERHSDREPDHEASRRKVLVSLATTARLLHEAGLFHRDLYWCHFFVRELEGGNVASHLIDLQRIRRSRWDRYRWQLKDAAQFVYSTPAGALDESDWQLWFETYFGVTTDTPMSLFQRLMKASVRIRAAFYRWKDGAP